MAAKISPIQLQHLQSFQMGRLKLALFREITGKDNHVPSPDEAADYIRGFPKEQIIAAEIATYILNDARFSAIGYEQLSENIDVGKLFESLNEHPYRDPMCYEIEGYLPEGPLSVLIFCHELRDRNGYFYSLVFLNDDYPRSINYFEIRTSQTHPEPAFSYYNQLGEFVSDARDSDILQRNEDMMLCIKALKFLSEHHIDSFMSVETALSKSDRFKSVNGDPSPHDPFYHRLIQRLYLGEIRCHVAEVDIECIVPYSFDACLLFPLHMIQQGKRNLEEFQKQGMVVYWNGANFLVSDDCLAYMAFRVFGVKKVKVIILGDPGTENLDIISSGGAELLPDIHTVIPTNYDSMDISVRKLYLDEHIAKLAAAVNLKSLLEAKCVVLSEDSDLSYLKVLLEANGFNMGETTLMSYQNCTKIDLLPLTLETLRKVNPSLKYIIHRDRDYLNEQEAEKISARIEAIGAIPFITIGTDIESHFLDQEHINVLFPQLSPSETEEFIAEALSRTREKSILKMIKAQYGEKYKSFLSESETFAERYHDDPARYCAGKETVNALKSVLHQKLKSAVEFAVPTSFLTTPVLKTVADDIWPY